jgi:hypothetical protein
MFLVAPRNLSEEPTQRLYDRRGRANSTVDGSNRATCSEIASNGGSLLLDSTLGW